MLEQLFINISPWTIVLILAAVFLLPKAIVIVKPKQYHFVLFLGKYWKTATPGFNLIIPYLSWVDKKASTALHETPVDLSLKTSNHVTFGLILKVQHQVSSDVKLAYKALYNLENYQSQLKSFATDAAIPVANGIELEDVYNKKEQIADKAKERLRDFFHDFGVEIVDVLSDEPRLPKSVEVQANKVMEMQREKQAAAYEAEAIREREVGKAKADGESVKIRMEKMGEARRVYAESAAEAVKVLTNAGTSADEALRFMTAIADNDALVSAARHGSTVVMATGQSQQVPVALPMPEMPAAKAKFRAMGEPQPA